MDPPIPTRPTAANLPNVLTYARIAAVPALVACLLIVEGEAGRWAAFWLLVGAAITDWVPG